MQSLKQSCFPLSDYFKVDIRRNTLLKKLKSNKNEINERKSLNTQISDYCKFQIASSQNRLASGVCVCVFKLC
jgi:hypothetical protein